MYRADCDCVKVGFEDLLFLAGEDDVFVSCLIYVVEVMETLSKVVVIAGIVTAQPVKFNFCMLVFVFEDYISKECRELFDI